MIRFILLTLTMGFGFGTPAFAQRGLEAVYREMADDPVMGDWFRDQTADALRTALERKVDLILKTDPTALKLRKELLPRLEARIRLQRGALLAVGGKAMITDEGSQFAEHLANLQTAARRLGFSQPQIDDLHLTLLNSAEINAFTFSGSAKYLDFVLYQGLNQTSSPKEVQLVAGHEFGHILGQHVLNASVIQAIFFLNGKILIPETDTVKQSLFESTHKAAGKSMFRMALGHGGDASLLDGLVEGLYADTIDVARATLAGAPHEADRIKLRASGQSLQRAATEDSEAPFDFDQFKKLQDAMERLGRAQEIMADRAGLLAVQGDIELAKLTMAKLGAGTGIDPKLIDDQLRELAAFIRESHVDPAQLDTGDHPAPYLRALQFGEFSTTFEYQRISDPFVRGLDLYLRLSKALAVAQNTSAARDSELVLDWVVGQDRAVFTGIAAKLSAELRKILVDEIRQGKAEGLVHWAKFLKYFEVAKASVAFEDEKTDKTRRKDLGELVENSDLRKPDRMFGMLVRELAAVPGDLAKKAIEQVKGLVSVSTEAEGIAALKAAAGACDGPLTAKGPAAKSKRKSS